MSNNRKIAFIAGIVLVMLLFVWLFSGGEAMEGHGRVYTSSNWSKKFQPFDKDPRGLYLFHTLAQTHIGKNEMHVAEDKLELDSIMNADDRSKTYMFIGNIFGILDNEMEDILERVEEGSHLFISYRNFTENIPDHFFDTLEYKYDYAESVNVFADKFNCTMINLYQQDTVACEWMAFGDVYTKRDSRALSSFMQLDNFIEIEWGEGSVLLQTNPEMFFNYQLKRQSGYQYSDYVLSFIPKDNDIVLLELGRRSDQYDSEGPDEGDLDEKDRSLLRKVFENPPLLYALLVSILGAILYIVFRSKRKHPVVPYVEQKKDMTLAFAETITSIYLSKKNPYRMLQIQRKNFYLMMQKHFFVDLQRREGDRELITLAEKSNKTLDEVKALIKQLETKSAGSVSDQTVAEVARKIRSFYKDTGIITDKIQERVEAREIVFRRSMLLPSLLVPGGVITILLGMYYLSASVGVGIVLWPIGLLITTVGVLRLSRPYMVLTGDTIRYYNAFGQKKEFNKDEIEQTELKASGVVITFTENRTLVINYRELSRFDRKQFDRFVSKLHKLEL